METYIKDKEIVSLLREQYDHELNNYRIYTNMAVYCSKLGLRGHVKYFKHRAHEEFDHSARVCEIIKDANLELLPGSMTPVTRNYTDLEEIHTEVLKLEENTTTMLNNLASKALKAGLMQLFASLQWLVNEQVEEEKISRDVLEMAKYETDDLTIDQAVSMIFE